MSVSFNHLSEVFIQIYPFRHKLPENAQSTQEKRHLHAQSRFRPSPLVTRKGLTSESPGSKKGHARAESGDSMQSFHWDKPASEIISDMSRLSVRERGIATTTGVIL